MLETTDLSYAECLFLLTSAEVGRVAMSTPLGPRIVPVNFTLSGDAVAFRAPPHSLLGTYAHNTILAFQVDLVDLALREGWSVVALGRASSVEDVDERSRIDEGWNPAPWSGDPRATYFKMPWMELTGRRLGGGV